MNYVILLFTTLIFSMTSCQKPPSDGNSDEQKEYNKPADLNLFGFYLESVLETEGEYNAEFLKKYIGDEEILYTDESMDEIKGIYEETASKIKENELGRVGPIGPIGPVPPVPPTPCICIPIDPTITQLLVEDMYEKYQLTIFNENMEEVSTYNSELQDSSMKGFRQIEVNFGDLKGEHIILVQRTSKNGRSAYAVNAYF